MEIATIQGERVILKAYVKVSSNKTRMVIGTKTPRQSEVAKSYKGQILNRAERRSLVFKNKVGKLIKNIRNLRKEMYKSGIKVPRMPRERNPKVLSGYKSRLIQLALA